MDSERLRGIQERIKGSVSFDVPLAPFTTFKIGGPAAAVVEPESVDDVVAVLGLAAETETPWMALGLGSNVLVSDRGFDGVVLRLGKGLDDVETSVGGDQTVWKVGAGFPTPQLARRTAKVGLGGVHCLVGVPGTVGGGVFMNAGAHGQDFAGAVHSVELVEADGSVRVVSGGDIRWRYRGSGLDGRVVTAATLQLEPADRGELEEDIRRHLEWRKAVTPFKARCCGSVFRNPTPPGARGKARSAGQLIDACGLKGHRV
ncbi:MAG: UDP-N-acetylmuramate dehydrogenase, partial [Gemmatimonadales bacterium]